MGKKKRSGFDTDGRTSKPVEELKTKTTIEKVKAAVRKSAVEKKETGTDINPGKGDSTFLPRRKAVDFFSTIFSGDESNTEDGDRNERDDFVERDQKPLRSKSSRKRKQCPPVLVEDVQEEFDEDEVEVVGVGVRPRRDEEEIKEEIKEEMCSDDDQEVDDMGCPNVMETLAGGNQDSELVNSDENSEREDIEDQDYDNNDNEDPEAGDATRTSIRKELSSLSFEELLQLKNKMGTKQYNEAMFGKQIRGGPVRSGNKKKKVFKRENKNRPRELPARVHVPRVREVVHVKKIVSRDPRFEEGCGELDAQIWDKNYEFLKDIQHKEAQDLAKTVKTIEDPEKRLEVRKYLQKLKNKEKSDSEKEKLRLRRQKEIEDNKKRTAEGKKPFYMKKSTRKLVDLAEKYEELKATGKLEKYLKKKRKKNLIRDKHALKIGKTA